MRKQRKLDPRNGPVTVISGDELKKRFPASEGVLAPKGIAVTISEYYFYAPFGTPARTITITDTELVDFAKTSADKLTPRERKALAGFRVRITQGEELTERQQGFLYEIIEKFRSGKLIKKTMLSPDEREKRNLICNALVALLKEKSIGEQVLLIFSKEVLAEARTALGFVLKDISILSKKDGQLAPEQIVGRVLSYIIKRIGHSETESFLEKDNLRKPYQIFFGAVEQESAINDMQRLLKNFPAALKTALEDYPRSLTSEQIVEIIDGMYPNFIAGNRGTDSISSVHSIPAGSPGSGKGGRNG